MVVASDPEVQCHFRDEPIDAADESASLVSMLDITRLRVLVAVARLGSVTAAAKSLR